MTDVGRVAVLMGGPSAEREISLISGRAVLAALRSRDVDAHAFDPAERELFDLKREGSTLGLTKVSTPADFHAAWKLAARYDELVVAEEFISGVELTASIITDRDRGEVALPLVRIEAPHGNYDYQNKYFTDETKYFCPANMRPEIEDAIRNLALKSFRVLGCRGWGRADVMLRPDGAYFFLEMNTSPGMTGHSLVPIAAKAAGLSYAELCVRILEDARLDAGRMP